MAYAMISKEFKFEAAHMLPNHDGKCRELHGHSYRVEVWASGRIQESGPKEGMVLDFAELSDVWKRHLEPLLDHRYLNDSLSEMVPITTAEHLSLWILDTFREFEDDVYYVRVWETATSSAVATSV